MDKYTPGPWTLTLNDTQSGDWAPYHYINSTGGQILAAKSEYLTEANACLIAAAPELFELLSELVNSSNAKENALWDRARAAVMKARGV